MGRFRRWEQRGAKPVREAQDFGSHSVRPPFGLEQLWRQRDDLYGCWVVPPVALAALSHRVSFIAVFLQGFSARILSRERMLFAGATKVLRTSSRMLRKISECSVFPRSTLKGSWMRLAKNPAIGRSASWLPRWGVETKITREISLRGEKYQIARPNARSAGTLPRCVAASSGRAESFAAFG